MREFGTRTAGHGVARRCAGPWNGIFLAGGKSLQCPGCSVTPLLVMPQQWVIPCILHCTMAIGHLQQDFNREESEGLSAADKIRLEGDLGDRKAGCSIFHSRSPDGEEFRALFDAWPLLACRLRIPTTALGTYMKSSIVHNSSFINERFIYEP